MASLAPPTKPLSASRVWLSECFVIISIPRLSSSRAATDSSGFGREIDFQALESGNKTTTTIRKPAALDDVEKQYLAVCLRVVKLDFTQIADIEAAFLQAKEALGRADIVFTDAGFFAVRTPTLRRLCTTYAARSLRARARRWTRPRSSCPQTLPSQGRR